MSEFIGSPEQLKLPFDAEDQNINTAKIFSLSDHRQSVFMRQEVGPLECNSLDQISKALERKILNEVLAEAEKLSWYK